MLLPLPPPTLSYILEVAIKPVVVDINNDDDAFASIVTVTAASSASSLFVDADTSCVGEAHCATYPIDAW